MLHTAPLPLSAAWRARLSGRRVGWACAALAVVTVAASQPLGAASVQDQQRALAARQGGRSLPLDTLITQVDAAIAGRLLEAELDDEDGIAVYELRWQLADGRRLEIEIDARDGRWRKLKGARLETVFRTAPSAAASAARTMAPR